MGDLFVAGAEPAGALGKKLAMLQKSHGVYKIVQTAIRLMTDHFS